MFTLGKGVNCWDELFLTLEKGLNCEDELLMSTLRKGVNC